MMQTNRLTILVLDGTVYIDQGSYHDLDFSNCGIPEEIRALDWKDGRGELHHNDTTIHHIDINELPEWALLCVAKWEERYTEEQNQPPIEEIHEPNP
jgi:hypothetical protein